MNLKRRLSQGERDELETLMELRDPSGDGPLENSVTCLHGFLTSIISGPPIMPSEWIPMVFAESHEASWETMEQAQRAMNLLMRFNNEISSYLERGRYTIMIDRLGEEPDTVDVADDWCQGYMVGLGMRENEWTKALEGDSEMAAALAPILTLAGAEGTPTVDPFDNPAQYAELLNQLPQCAQDIRDLWLGKHLGLSPGAQQATIRREAPKVPVNAPCPCGSGKKYKRCCGSPLRAV